MIRDISNPNHIKILDLKMTKLEELTKLVFAQLKEKRNMPYITDSFFEF